MTMTEDLQVAAALSKARVAHADRFFSPLKNIGAAIAIGSSVLQSIEVRPLEHAFVARAVRTRQVEFALGRTLARAALRQIGVAPVDICAGADRAPIWPPGVVGSITHCGDIGGAVVIPEINGKPMVGIDIERLTATSDLIEVITTPRERQRQWFCQHVDADLLSSLCFSAKESAYKAFYPRLQRFLDFTDVELDFDFPSENFTARLASHLAADSVEVCSLSGRFSYGCGLVMTTAIGFPDQP